MKPYSHLCALASGALSGDVRFPAIPDSPFADEPAQPAPSVNAPKKNGEKPP